MTGLNGETIEPDHSIASFALESLAAVELAHAIERELGLSTSAASVLDGRSIHEFAVELANSFSMPVQRVSGREALAGSREIKEFSLSPGQRSLWFLQQL